MIFLISNSELTCRASSRVIVDRLRAGAGGVGGAGAITSMSRSVTAISRVMSMTELSRSNDSSSNGLDC